MANDLYIGFQVQKEVKDSTEISTKFQYQNGLVIYALLHIFTSYYFNVYLFKFT